MDSGVEVSLRDEMVIHLVTLEEQVLVLDLACWQHKVYKCKEAAKIKTIPVRMLNG